MRRLAVTPGLAAERATPPGLPDGVVFGEPDPALGMMCREEQAREADQVTHAEAKATPA